MGTPFVSFFIILLVAVIFSQFFSRMRVPWAVALILGGVLIGPSGVGIFEPNETIEFLATIGLVFLMFMAGIESKFSGSKGLKKHIAITSVLIATLPAAAGAALALFFGYQWPTAVLLGIVFMSSSISLLIPQLESQKIIHSDLGRVLIGSTIAADAASLVFLSLFLQHQTGGSFDLLTLSTYLMLALFVAGTAWFIPRIKWLSEFEKYPEKQDMFEKELRFIILVLIGFVVLFELIGLHAIIAAFFAGLVLSGTIKSYLTKAKLHAIGYGFFIPVFFVVIGSNIDLSSFSDGTGAVALLLSAVSVLIAFKFVSGFLSGKLSGFTSKESTFLGVSVIPQLSTGLAVAFFGFGAGIVDENLLASIVAITIVTTTVAPLIANVLGPKLTSQHVVFKEAHEPGKTLEKK